MSINDVADRVGFVSSGLSRITAGVALQFCWKGFHYDSVAQFRIEGIEINTIILFFNDKN